MNENIRRANTYKIYTDDPTFREPWDKVRAAFVARWQTTQPGEHEVRETIFRYLGLMDKLDAYVGSVIASGEIDKARFEDLIARPNDRGPNELD